MKTATLFLSLLSALVILGSAAQAQTLLESYAKPMPDIKLMPAADFEKYTALFEETPFNNPALAFSYRLPKNWLRAKDTALGNDLPVKILTDLVRFDSPPSQDVGSSYLVQGLKLEYPQTAHQWMIQYMVNNGYTLEGIKIDDEKRAEALYVGLEGDNSYIIRATLQMNGKYALLAQLKMPVDNWDADKQFQAAIGDSFRIKNPVDEQIETTKDYRFLDVGQVTYPVTWQMRASPVKTVDDVGLELFNVDNGEDKYGMKSRALNGKMGVRVIADVPGETLAQKIEKLKENLAASGLVIKEPIEQKEKIKLDAVAQKPALEVYSASYKQNPQLSYELWISGYQSGGYTYFTTLETPSREKDFFTWARNTETYRLVAKSLKPSAL